MGKYPNIISRWTVDTKKYPSTNETYTETQLVEEGPLDDPSSSVVEVAAAAVTGGHKAVK